MFHNTDTFYLPSHFPLVLSFSIDKNGFDTVAFRHAGKSPDNVGITGPICFKVLLEMT